MSQRYLMGVDLGTSSTKAALYTTEGGLAAQGSAEVPLYYPQPNAVEQNIDDFYRTAAQTVRQCVQESGIDPRQVAAIAFDSQMAGVGGVDDTFNSAMRFDSWLDMRCQPYIEAIDARAGDLITRLTGCPPTCDHAPKIMWWRHERPETYRRVAKFVMPAGYVAGRMAGLRADEAFIDYTFIHFSGLSNTPEGQWSPELCHLLGVDMAKLPEIVEPWRVIGEVSEDAARDFGLAPGTPIAAGCGDTAAGALGAGIVRPGMILDTAGTAAVLAGCTDAFAPDVGNRVLLVMRSVIPGLWHPLAYTAGVGQTLEWFRDAFYRSGAEKPVGSLFDVMADEAATVPAGAEGLFFSPHLNGRICPATPEMKGAWLGFSWRHTPAHFFRSILEGVAFEYAYYLHILRQLIPDLSLVEARVVGGGAKSAVWNQIKADVLGVPYQRLQEREFATWGSAIIAGKAAGIYEDMAEIATRHAQPAGPPATPNPENRALYDAHLGKYIGIQKTLAETFVRLGSA
jgi:xylulokinase